MVDGVPEYSYYEHVEQPPSAQTQFEYPDCEIGVPCQLDPNDPAAMPEEDIIYVPPPADYIRDPVEQPEPVIPEPDPDWVDGP